MPHREVPATPNTGVAAELYQQLMPRVPALAREVLDRIVAAVPQYRKLPAEELTGDIVRTIERSIVLFLRSFVDDRMPDENELSELRSSAALRAEEGIPLDTVIGVYHLGANVVWDKIMGDVEDAHTVRAVHEHTMKYLHAIVPAVAASYVDVRWTVLGEEHNDRQVLLASLLEGGPPAALSATSTATLAAGYVVLSLRIAPHPDEATAGLDAEVVARRKIRRLRAEAEHFARGPLLSTVDSTAGLLLIPQQKPADELTAADWVELSSLIARMSKVAGAEVTAGAHAADPSKLAGAAKLAREVLEVVIALRKPARLYRLSDVLFEYQLSRPGPARDGLVAMLDPLEGKDDLLDTLGAYIEHACNRRRAAHALHVHPNTVDYRLGRVAELSGLVPTDPHDVRLLAAAYAAKAIVQV